MDAFKDDGIGPVVAIIAVTAVIGYFLYATNNQPSTQTAVLFPIEKTVPTIVPMQPQ